MTSSHKSEHESESNSVSDPYEQENAIDENRQRFDTIQEKLDGLVSEAGNETISIGYDDDVDDIGMVSMRAEMDTLASGTIKKLIRTHINGEEFSIKSAEDGVLAYSCDFPVSTDDASAVQFNPFIKILETDPENVPVDLNKFAMVVSQAFSDRLDSGPFIEPSDFDQLFNDVETRALEHNSPLTITFNRTYETITGQTIRVFSSTEIVEPDEATFAYPATLSRFIAIGLDNDFEFVAKTGRHGTTFEFMDKAPGSFAAVNEAVSHDHYATFVTYDEATVPVEYLNRVETALELAASMPSM